jgi:hypothetical protein
MGVPAGLIHQVRGAGQENPQVIPSPCAPVLFHGHQKRFAEFFTTTIENRDHLYTYMSIYVKNFDIN